jgi:hypothetical protein
MSYDEEFFGWILGRCETRHADVSDHHTIWIFEERDHGRSCIWKNERRAKRDEMERVSRGLLTTYNRLPSAHEILNTLPAQSMALPPS